MKVILLKTMPKLGKEGEIINVNDGYARNYVLPQKLGVEATPDNLNKLKYLSMNGLNSSMLNTSLMNLS